MKPLEYAPAKHFYADQEDAFIRDNYLMMPDRAIAQRLNRSTASIITRRYRLGLRKDGKHAVGSLTRKVRSSEHGIATPRRESGEGILDRLASRVEDVRQYSTIVGTAIPPYVDQMLGMFEAWVAEERRLLNEG